MAFELKTEFDSLEDAIAYLKGEVKTHLGDLEGEKSALLRKRDELLGDLRKTKDKYSKFSEYADRDDLDIAELLRIKEQSESGSSDIESKYRSAYEADKEKFEKRLRAIEKEREDERAEREREREAAQLAQLKADAIAEFSKESHRIRNPEQFWLLFGQGKIQRSEEGTLFIGDEYKQQSLGEYVQSITEDENNLHHFKPSGASGSGSNAGGSGGGGQTRVNPWRAETFNLTEQGRIVRTNPDLAKRLKAEAGVK